MKLRYLGGFDAVTVPLPSGLEVTCERGGTIDVPDDYGAVLTEQSIWSVVVDKKKPAATAAEGD